MNFLSLLTGINKSGSFLSSKIHRAKLFPISLCVILITIITFAAFSSCLKNDFVNWDDDVYVVQNPHIREWSPAGIVRIFTP